MNDTRIWHLVEVIKTGDWKEKLSASEELVAAGSAEVVDNLIPLLKEHNREVRNAAALALIEIGDTKAVSPLLEAIELADEPTDQAALIYALKSLDCSSQFLRVFTMAIAKNEETKAAAQDILFGLGFGPKTEDIARARDILDDARSQILLGDYLILRNYLNNM